jgi:hypothetical protein
MKTNLSPIVASIRTGVLTIAVTGFLAVLAVVMGCLTGHSGAASTNDTTQARTSTNLAVGVAADYEKYKNGQISKEAMIQSVWNANNQTRQDMFGKVIDQDGHPVAGVDVTGIIIMIGEKNTRYKTQTDAEGLFQFTGLHGSDIGADVAKEGYEMDYQKGIHKPSGQSTPNNRVVYTMWKLRGPEPMKYAQIQSSVPCDGTPEHFDLLSSKMNNTVADVHPSSGDFTVKLTRDPLIVDRRKPFNWSVILSITNGGLLEFTNQPYPYEAPETGYQSVVTMDFPTNVPQWQNEIKKNYFFKSGDGRVYGRMTVDLRADRPQPPTYFNAEIFANRNGSRNLEFDPKKEIMR